jgi:predicted metal-dependent enzyme (double-stranded beta helix superfamily)
MAGVQDHPVPVPRSSPASRAAALVQRIDAAVACGDPHRICPAIKTILCEEVGGGRLTLPEEMLVPARDQYARRLLHRDPQLRYSIVVMVWGAGQGTPIHDHSGMWCVECVFRGQIVVTSYEMLGEEPSGHVRFRRESTVHAGCGEAGALIPPWDYHVIENTGSAPAATIHVYGGEMNGCHSFAPVEGDRYARQWKPLRYTS